MKRKWTDARDWRRIIGKRFSLRRIDDRDYKGIVTLLHIDKVSEPIWAEMLGRRLCIADSGYTWLQHFPEGAHHSLITVFDEQGEVVYWYIDICGLSEVGEDGVLWYDDLYLDIALLPSGEIGLLDVAELDEAFYREWVTHTEYDLAWQEANGLLMALEEDMLPLLWLAEVHRQRLLE